MRQVLPNLSLQSFVFITAFIRQSKKRSKAERAPKQPTRPLRTPRSWRSKHSLQKFLLMKHPSIS